MTTAQSTPSYARPIEAVVFDMDGLLLDTERLSRRSWIASGADLGLDIPISALTAIIGGRRNSVEATFRAELGDDFPVDALYERHAVHYYANLNSASAESLRKPGVLALLDWMDSVGMRRAIATSTLTAGAAKKLALSELSTRFDIVVTGDQVAHSKPAPDIFLEAASRLGVPPEHCVAFEDSDLGMLSALSAGMRVIGVPDLKPMHDDVRPRVHAVLESLEHAVPVLSQWLQDHALGRAVGDSRSRPAETPDTGFRAST